ncbi:predicted protein [Botrytis cinerea T4]|uniref:Uncharacterized protein n=1 Tax=Botryotinia fuckeliana (strain T4) TaxID=999810 RepID=G2XQN1_BOTF4|nr:predicted protein [Botrytis cinerea T4]
MDISLDESIRLKPFLTPHFYEDGLLTVYGIGESEIQ